MYSTKVTPLHLKKKAYVYVRQSSPKQVRVNLESQANQYALRDKAIELGWLPEQVFIVDSDLGTSGRFSEGRDGFKELVAEVSLGQVGIILGYEVSRLSRNCKDWYQLLELCSIFGTLIVDSDGIYDLNDYNDRLLLGLKGTMSEAELHFLRLRLEAGRLNKAKRGDLVHHLPTGYIRDLQGVVIQDPDLQIRSAIELVFEVFEQLGNGQKVLRYLHQQGLLLPRRQTSGLEKGQVVWRKPSASAILEILKNPAYAGAFAYGKKQLDPKLRKPGHPSSGRIRKPEQEWISLVPGKYPAYISWEQYERNQRRLRENYGRFQQMRKGKERSGAALLQGLTVCGRCGRMMKVTYKGRGWRYFCDSMSYNFAEPSCGSIEGHSVDEVVVAAFFEAIGPSKIDLLEQLLGEQGKEREKLDQQWRYRLEKTTYEVRLAQRQYDSVDPLNRLVALELEKRWEEKLRELKEVEESYEKFKKEPPPAELDEGVKGLLREISESLPLFWENGRLGNEDKKSLIRTLVSRVVLKRVHPYEVEVKIVWISKNVSNFKVYPPIHRICDAKDYEEMVRLIKELYEKGMNDQEICNELNGKGFRSARLKKLNLCVVRKIRIREGLYSTLHKFRGKESFDGYITMRGLYKKLGVPRNWVYNRISSGKIKPIRHPETGNYVLEDDPLLIEHLSKMKKKKLHRSKNVDNKQRPGSSRG